MQKPSIDALNQVADYFKVLSEVSVDYGGVFSQIGSMLRKLWKI